MEAHLDRYAISKELGLNNLLRLSQYGRLLAHDRSDCSVGSPHCCRMQLNKNSKLKPQSAFDRRWLRYVFVCVANF